MPVLPTTTPSEELLAAVYYGSMLSMQHSMPTAQPLARYYFEEEGSETPLGNTFLNFFPSKPDLERRQPRSRSVGLCCRPPSLAAPAPAAEDAKVKPVFGTALESTVASQGNDVLAEVESTKEADAESGSAWSSTVQTSTAESTQMGLDIGGDARQEPQSKQAKTRTRRHKRKSPRTSSQTSEAQKILRLSDDTITTHNAVHAPVTTAARPQPPRASYTTIILQNLPAILTQVNLLRTLEEHGWKNTFDFCYLPVNFSTGDCRGYAFINFKQSEVASSFKHAWHKSHIFYDCNHEKPVLADVAELQGVDALLAQPSMKKLQRVKNVQYRPFVALDGCARP
eukprot:CAMPEP_0178382332 /NCGR_PEP_ID=MMETSP0689_2-20121128/6439_1 /TAXON_ID=160604 /ORGANISM="Amphidinium massartii, Strain CS-259" /LENGTH=339 /DNA_ID=CAMNT_0020002533 /DNA_START=41 /DNA_END=1060 /DNA_ORIENTATION=+